METGVVASKPLLKDHRHQRRKKKRGMSPGAKTEADPPI